MARIIHDDQNNPVMDTPQAVDREDGGITVIQADGQAKIDLPDGDFLTKGDILRDGQDLVLQSSDGAQIVIEDYFSAMPAPALATPQGGVLTPELVDSFVKTAGPVQHAASETESDASAVGLIKEVSGDATITRTDGTTEKVTLGMEVHQGDIVETSPEGAVNIVFLDESSFAISSDARLAIDEYVFDPATQGGETNISILRGMFVFTSGLIGRDDPDDVHINTPVGSIGIRGTTIAGRIDPNGESQITVVEGAIVITNGATTVTLADQYETAKLTGFDSPIQMAGTLDSSQMQAHYGMLGTVNPVFFNTLNTAPESNAGEGPAPAEAGPADMPAETGPTEPAPANAAPEPAIAPQTMEAPLNQPLEPVTESKTATTEPVIASYDIFSDPLNSGFEQNIMPQAGTFTSFDASKPIASTFLSGTMIAPMPVNTTTTTTINTATTTTTTSTTQPLFLPPLELVLQVMVDDESFEGDIVGIAFTTVPYPGAVMSFAHVPVDGNGDPLFSLAQQGPGVYNLILTQAGETVIGSTTLNSILGNVEVKVLLADGRTDSATAPAYFGDFDTATGGGPLPPLDLDNMPAFQGYKVTGDPGTSLGYNAAYLGDFDRDGTNDIAVTTNVPSAGAIALFDGSFTDITVSVGAEGLRVSNSGDLNGDGRLDFLTGRPYADPAANTEAGIAVLHSGANIATVTIRNGGAAGDMFGSSVAMTDFNGDGYSDAFIGAQGYNGGDGTIMKQQGSGSYAWGTDNYTAFANGGSLSFLGMSMTGLQDFNNDGFGDLAVGGASFVNIYLGNVSGAAVAPIAISGIATGAGHPVIDIYDAGDVNGGGASDLLIYASGGSGAAYLLYGGALTSGSIGARASVTITSGSGYLTGAGSAGDFNGDGLDDIFVAVHSGTTIDAFVIYGSDTLAGSIVIDPTWLANNEGSYFHMMIDLADHGSISSVSISSIAAGDQNGDGFEDLLISSPELNLGDGGFYLVHGRPDQADMDASDPDIHTDAGGYPNAGANMISSSSGDGLIGGGANNIMANLNGANIHTDISFQAGAGNDLINLHGTGANLARVLDGGAGHDELKLISGGSIDLRNISEFSGIEKIIFGANASQSMTIGLNDIFSLLQSSNDFIDADGAGGMTSRYALVFSETGDADAETLNIDNPGTATGSLTSGNAGLQAAIGLTYAGNAGGYNVYNHGSGYQVLIDQDITVNVV